MAFRSTGLKKNFQKRITQQGIVEEDPLWSVRPSHLQEGLNYNLSVVDYVKMLNDLSLAQEGRRLNGEEWIFQQDNPAIHNASITRSTCLNKKKISWQDFSYRKFVGIDCCKNLWRRSTVLSNFWIQKRNLRRMGKIPSVQLQKLVDSMPSRIFEVIKANGGSSKY